MAARLAAFILLLLGGGLFSAEDPKSSIASVLRWEKDKLDLGRHLSGGDIELVFTAKNTGDKPLSILEIKPGCGCIVQETELTSVAPGATLKVKLLFHTAGKEGAQEQFIQIATDEPLTHYLTFTADLIEPLKMTPRLLIWQKGAEAKPKSAKLRLADAPDLAKMEILRGSPDFNAVLEPGAEHGVWNLRVTPLDCSMPVQASLVLRGTTKRGTEDKVLHVLIK